MVTVFQAYVVPIFTGIIIIGGILWLLFLFFYWLPKYLGLGRTFLKMRLKWKYKNNFEYDDETISLCKTAITRGWTLKDIMKLTKKSPHKDEILYTFIMMLKIKNDWYNPEEYHNKQHKPQSNTKFLEDVVKKIK